MTLDEARLAIDLAQIMGLLALGLYQWLERRHRATREQIEALENGVEGQLKDLSQRVIRLEGEVHHLPTARGCAAHLDRIAKVEEAQRHAPDRSDLGRLHQRIDRVSEDMREVKGGLDETRRTLALIHDYLLHGGGTNKS